MNGKIKKLFLVFTMMFSVVAVFAGGAKEVSINNIDLTMDRAGCPITLPAKVDRVISMAPSISEIIIDLKLESKIVASDTNTQKDGLIKKEIPYFNMMSPDTEKLIALKPDVIFYSGMANAKGTTPYAPLIEAGICVINIPSSSSIESIYTDILYIASVLKAEKEANNIISNMKKEIEAIKEKASSISDDKKKTVYFEIAAAPHMYSLGKNTFIHEMIEIIGAKNIFSEEESWIPVSDEMILAKDPDIILTTVNYIPNPIEEIINRPGWDVLKAVKTKQIFSIDANAASRPNHNIIKALKEMFNAIYQ